MSNLDSVVRHSLSELAALGRLRQLPQEFRDSHRDFSGNDYMGLGERFLHGHPEIGGRMTSSASRLLAASQDSYTRLEAALGRLYSRNALIFNSGYHANTGVVSALGQLPSVLIVADRLVHASIIDGIRLSGAPFVRFRHNDINHLHDILEKKSKDYSNVFVVTEGIFSMDGDVAPLKELVSLKNEFGFSLYLDEAHSFGVLGDRGLGLAEAAGLIRDVDIIIGTFGKAAASYGAFAAVSEDVKTFLLNSSRSFIFSTSLPEANILWTLYMVRELLGMDSARCHLKEISDYFRKGLEEITNAPNISVSQIIPLIVGDARKAVALSERLREKGFRALAIRKPTVPEGTERIRFSLGTHHTFEDIDNLLEAIRKSI